MVLLRLVLYGECDEPEFYQFLRGQGVFLQLLDFYRWICLTRNWHSGLTGVSHFLVRWLIRYVLWCTVCSSHEWGRKDAFSYGLPIEIIFRLHTHTHTHLKTICEASFSLSCMIYRSLWAHASFFLTESIKQKNSRRNWSLMHSKALNVLSKECAQIIIDKK